MPFGHFNDWPPGWLLGVANCLAIVVGRRRGAQTLFAFNTVRCIGRLAGDQLGSASVFIIAVARDSTQIREKKANSRASIL
jgi:hypothetical protein